VKDSNKVVEICTIYAQKGMQNIFMVIFFSTLAFACLDPYFFIGYLISMALFGLYQAFFMANAGGAWDNAKKIVETELRAKGTELHAASVVGDTVGDPFKDTSSVALNPVIKFTTLFGVLAVGLALKLHEDGNDAIKYTVCAISLVISMFFAWRSFYGMRIGADVTLESLAKDEKHQAQIKAYKALDAKPEDTSAEVRTPRPPVDDSAPLEKAHVKKSDEAST